MLQNLVGNEELKGDLSKALSAQKLSHGILLCGERGCGCGFAARCLAADHLYPEGGDGARAVMEGRSAECIEIEGEGASGEIRIERIRAMRRDIFDTALSARGRAVILYGAQKLNQSSANALLKVLEEPPEGVLFVLTSSGSAAVLPTIRSRCQIYNLSPVGPELCAQWLRQNCPGCEEPDELALIFAGCIGRAKLAASDEEAKKSLADAKTMAELIGKKDSYRLMIALSAYEKDKPAARRLLEDLRSVAAAALRSAEGGYGLSHPAAARCAKLTGWALEGLSRNLNQKLLFTDLALRLGR